MLPLLLTAALPLLIGAAIFGLPGLAARVGRGGSRWLPALAAAIVLADLLPESLRALGPAALLVAAVAAVLPGAAESALEGRLHTHGRLGLELGFLSLTLHQATDGFGLALSRLDAHDHGHGGHDGYLTAVVLHSLPLLLAAALSLRERLGTGPALLRLSALSGATLLGGLTGLTTGAELPPALMPWLQAILGGLVLHMIAHTAHRHAPAHTHVHTETCAELH